MSLYNDELVGAIGVARQSRADVAAPTCNIDVARRAIAIAATRITLAVSIMLLAW
jgi:hypothetical protein